MKQIVQIDLADAVALRTGSANAIACRIADQETLITLSPELLAAIHLNGAGPRSASRAGRPRRVFTQTFRDKVVTAIKNRDDGESVAAIAKRHGIHRTLAQTWFTQREGRPSSDRARPATTDERRRYSAKFKAKAVEAARERDAESVGAVAKRLGIPDANLLRWMKKAGVK
jgi:transposase-like protein